MSIAKTREEDSTLGDQLRRGIEDDILSGRLKPGDRLDERALAERYGASRTPVREALLQLSYIGLVTARPRQGSIVSLISFSRFVQMVEVMRFTEASAAEMAARRMSMPQREELQRIQSASSGIIERGDFQAFTELNWGLHLAIFQGSGNEFLAEQARTLRLRLHPYRALMVRISGRMPQVHAEHEALVAAIVGGKDRAAHDAMSAHLALDATRLADLAALLPAAEAVDTSSDTLGPPRIGAIVPAAIEGQQ